MSFIFLQCAIALGQGTAFTYQGKLSDAQGGQALNGSYDFTFALYTTVTNGAPVAGPITNQSIQINNGVFVTTIDFGDVFTGSNYWLDIAVRTNNGPTFNELAPRQWIASAPYAMLANRANNLAGVPAGSLVTNNGTGVNLTGSFAGNGVGLTNLNGAAVGSGTVADARLSINVALLNTTGQTWNPAGTSIFGAVVISNVNTTNIPLQIYTNLNATNGNSPMLQMGTLASPGMASIGLNPGHGGMGDGSELGVAANQIAIVGTGSSGGRIQVGGQGLVSPWAISLQDVGFASSSLPYTANGGIVDWKYGWWDGAEGQRFQIDTSISTVNVTSGQGTLTTFDAFASVFDNDSPNGQTHRMDINSGLGVKNYGAAFLDYVSTPVQAGTNYSINMAMAAQDVYLLGPLNISIANADAITNTAFNTSSALVSDVFFYSGYGSNAISFSNNPAINLLWESETGTVTAPAFIGASNVLHLHLTLAVTSGVTNCFASYKVASFVPQVDADAQKFFQAISGSGGSVTQLEKAAVNELVLSMKADGSWFSNDVIYPFVGGTTNSMCWNLKNTNSFRLVFHGAVTANSFGFTGDGSTGYADTSFKLASSGTNYSQHEGSLTLYNHAGGVGRFFGARDSGSVFTVLQSNSIVDVNWSLNSDTGPTISQTSGLGGFYCFMVHAGSLLGFTSNGSVMDTDATVAPPTQNIYLGARNAQGNADSFSTATISFFAIGGGLGQRMERAIESDVLNFERTLGR